VRIALGGRQQAKPSAGLFCDAQARVKRWGKSPPLRWRRRRHGKPRVEQGQIGGEGWPGPLKILNAAKAA